MLGAIYPLPLGFMVLWCLVMYRILQVEVWVVMPCSVGVGYRRFIGTCCLHLQGEDGGSMDL